MELEGPLGRRLIIEASTDLTHWQPVATNIFNTAGRTTFNLPNSPSPSIFYRGSVSP